MILEGIIQKDGSVLGDDGVEYHLPVRGTDEDGYSEVLMDAKSVGGRGWIQRQSIKPYIGMKVIFFKAAKKGEGYNYKIIKEEKNK